MYRRIRGKFPNIFQIVTDTGIGKQKISHLKRNDGYKWNGMLQVSQAKVMLFFIHPKACSTQELSPELDVTRANLLST